MRMLTVLAVVAACLTSPTELAAQSAGADTTVVKTIPLRHLSTTDAVLLLNPYVTGHGNVYPAGTSIHAVTIRANARTVVELEKVLAQYDRSPISVTLNFQLIAADNSNRRDPSVAGVDSVLRSVLRFSSYHLLANAVVTVAENGVTQQQLSAEGQDYTLTCQVHEITGEGSDASIQLQVSLRRVPVAGSQPEPTLLSTGVTIPLGHTVVLGSSVDNARAAQRVLPANGAGEASPGFGNGTRGEKALILVVRPQTASKRD